MEIRDFTKVGDELDVPELARLQRRSYDAFLQADVVPHEREGQGMEALFREIFPIEPPGGTVRLEYLYYEFGEPPYSEEQCRRLGMTYAYPLYLRLRTVSGDQAIEEDVYIGDIPIMIGGGEFIVNGSERIIVAQIQRSPGVDFSESVDSSGRKTYACRVIPERGTWLEFSVGRRGALYVRMGQGSRMPATWLLRSLFIEQSEDAEILALFYGSEEANLKRTRNVEKLVGRYLADEIVDTGSGEIVARAGTVLTPDLFQELRSGGIETLNLLVNVDDPLIVQTIHEDPCNNAEEALLKIYARLRPGVPRSPKAAREFIEERFSNPRRYNLGRVGRFRMNRKFDHGVAPEEMTLTAQDVLAAIRYLLGLRRGEGEADDIDHLGNRLLRPIGKLAEMELRDGLLRFRYSVRERLALVDESLPAPRSLAGSKAIAGAINTFFSRDELSQVVDQTNPLAQLQHERRISALGPGGLNRKRAGFDVRDVHVSHYGRICPIETPEGPNIGLISSLSLFADVDEYGFLVSPYREIHNGKPSHKLTYLRADEEGECWMAPARDFSGVKGLARYKGEFLEAENKRIEYMDVSPKQLVGVSASLIPFLEHNDANRALMGSNMQRQAVPLLQTEPPLVTTGMEKVVARNSSMVVRAVEDGAVDYVDAARIVVSGREYRLRKFLGLNEHTCLNQKPAVAVGDRVTMGQIIADGAATADGELALGRNLLVAFMSWNGYNFEDAIVISERVVANGKYTSIHIEELNAELRETRLGREEFTRDIPNVSESALAHLDEAGIVCIGTTVEPGDILVGKIAPKTKVELTPEERLVRAIFGRAGEDVKNESLTVPPGSGGVVVGVEHYRRKTHLSESERRGAQREAQRVGKECDDHIAAAFLAMIEELADVPVAPDMKFQKPKGLNAHELVDMEATFAPDYEVFHPNSRARVRNIVAKHRLSLRRLKAVREREIRRIRVGDELPSGVLEMVKVRVATKRMLSVGDKMAGRHGNKGVIARIVPEEDMPYLPDGTPVEIVLNPLGVPSRMNVGQILETHLGWAAAALGFRAVTPVFDGATEDEIRDCLREASLPETGKTALLDGRTGEPFDQEVTVGYIYMMKLDHLVEDKVHARATGPYSLITQQPLGGKARQGGQRLGEMEVWALEAYGAAYTLQEMLTVKSDDVEGRGRIYESMVKGRNILEAGRPLSFDVLVNEIRGLGFNVTMNTGSTPRESRARGALGKPEE